MNYRYELGKLHDDLAEAAPGQAAVTLEVVQAGIQLAIAERLERLVETISDQEVDVQQALMEISDRIERIAEK